MPSPCVWWPPRFEARGAEGSMESRLTATFTICFCSTLPVLIAVPFYSSSVIHSSVLQKILESQLGSDYTKQNDSTSNIPASLDSVQKSKSSYQRFFSDSKDYLQRKIHASRNANATSYAKTRLYHTIEKVKS